MAARKRLRRKCDEEPQEMARIWKVSLAGALLLLSNPWSANEASAAIITPATMTVKDNTVELNKIASYSTGMPDPDGGVAEIVKYNPDNQKFYMINGKGQTIDIVSLNGLTSEVGQQLQKEKSIQYRKCR